MGQSITQEQAFKLSALTRAGRACKGPVRSSAGCLTRATRKVTTLSWVYELGAGDASERELPMCTRHARLYPVGLEGKNFRVLSQGPLS